jgi:PAS domain S-box-containing protein
MTMDPQGHAESARYRALFENATDAIFIMEKDAFVDCNPAALEMLQLRRDEVIGSSPLAFSPEIQPDGTPSADAVRNLLAATLAGRPQRFEWTHLRADGTSFTAEVRLNAVEIGHETLLQAIVRDRSTEQEAREAIHQEAMRSKSYLEVAGVMLVAIDRNQMVVLVNPKCSQVLECKAAEIVGKNWFDLFIPEAERRRVKDGFARLMRGEIEAAEYYENSVVTHTGRERIIAWHNALVHNDDGDIIGTLSSGEDITEKREAEKQLRLAVAEIRKLKERAEAENVYLLHEIRKSHLHGEMVGQSGALTEVLTQAEQVAETSSTVLIHGETGTGKELLARAIHKMSSRQEHPLVIVNCAAMPSTLVESELFGREKGAYTGAMTRQVGRFELASGSTIFLDEIGELSGEVQVKLLRVLQEGEIQRLGSNETIKVDVRVIAATNRDLSAAVQKKEFREDLYYRLNVFPLTMPPLRKRREDIPLLVWHFVRYFGEHMGKSVDTIPRKIMEQLQSYPWPGNIRELRNTIERAMIRSNGPVLKVWMPSMIGVSPARPVALDDVQRQHILDILQQTNWRVRGKNGAAELLRLKPSTLESRMSKLGIKRPE